MEQTSLILFVSPVLFLLVKMSALRKVCWHHYFTVINATGYKLGCLQEMCYHCYIFTLHHPVLSPSGCYWNNNYPALVSHDKWNEGLGTISNWCTRDKMHKSLSKKSFLYFEYILNSFLSWRELTLLLDVMSLLRLQNILTYILEVWTWACGMLLIHQMIFVHVLFSVTVFPAQCDCMTFLFIHSKGKWQSFHQLETWIHSQHFSSFIVILLL